MPVQYYRWLADLILVLHFGFVSFVVLGFVLIWVGRLAGWHFVRNIYFRLLHQLAMGIVAAESLLDYVCPLTDWESRLRQLAGDGGAPSGSFIQHWLHRIMFYEVSEDLLTKLYAAFFGLVLLSLWLVKPAFPKRRTSSILR